MLHGLAESLFTHACYCTTVQFKAMKNHTCMTNKKFLCPNTGQQDSYNTCKRFTVVNALGYGFAWKSEMFVCITEINKLQNLSCQ